MAQGCPTLYHDSDDSAFADTYCRLKYAGCDDDICHDANYWNRVNECRNTTQAILSTARLYGINDPRFSANVNKARQYRGQTRPMVDQIADTSARYWQYRPEQSEYEVMASTSSKSWWSKYSTYVYVLIVIGVVLGIILLLFLFDRINKGSTPRRSKRNRRR